MSILAQDTFVEASTIDLSAHTADIGGGWTDAGGTVQVISGIGLIGDANASSGNRYNMTTGITPQPIEVKCTMSSSDSLNTFPGVAARRSTAASTSGGYEFTYLAGVWHISDSTNAVNLTEAWDGSAGEFKLHVEDGLAIGYFNGVEKVRLTTNLWPTGAFAGVVLGNFTGTEFKIQGANFEVDSVASLLTPTNDDGAPHLLHRPVRDDTIVTVFM
jgi:hypothetical protein